MPHTKEARSKKDQKTKKVAAKHGSEEENTLDEIAPPSPGKAIRMPDFDEEEPVVDDRATEGVVGEETEDALTTDEDGLDETDLNPFGDKWEE